MFGSLGRRRTSNRRSTIHNELVSTCHRCRRRSKILRSCFYRRTAARIRLLPSQTLVHFPPASPLLQRVGHERVKPTSRVQVVSICDHDPVAALQRAVIWVSVHIWVCERGRGLF